MEEGIKMNTYDRYLLNQVNIFMAECYENNTILPPKTIIDMFGKIFNNDITYIKSCPDGLENSLQNLVDDIKKYISEEFKSSLKVFLVCYYDILNYENVAKKLDMPNPNKDRYWYKAMISHYVLDSMLIEKKNSVEQFKVEHGNIGTLIGNYYKENDNNKAMVIRNIIAGKLRELYYRYDIKFDFPALCS